MMDAGPLGLGAAPRPVPEYRAKAGCRKCYGRGYTGKLPSGLPELCRCVARQIPAALAGEHRIRVLPAVEKWPKGSALTARQEVGE